VLAVLSDLSKEGRRPHCPVARKVVAEPDSYPPQFLNCRQSGSYDLVLGSIAILKDMRAQKMELIKPSNIIRDGQGVSMAFGRSFCVSCCVHSTILDQLLAPPTCDNSSISSKLGV